VFGFGTIGRAGGEGIKEDLIAETVDEKFWAVQSKAYALNHSVTKRDFDMSELHENVPIVTR
jgi:hypothetical protein